MRPVHEDPNAPHTLAALPDYWDERRHRQGKPDASTCAADLSVALEQTLATLRAHWHAAKHVRDGDAYTVGVARGLLIAHDLITGTLPLDTAPGALVDNARAVLPSPAPAPPGLEPHPDSYPFKRG